MCSKFSSSYNEQAVTVGCSGGKSGISGLQKELTAAPASKAVG